MGGIRVTNSNLKSRMDYYGEYLTIACGKGLLYKMYWDKIGKFGRILE